jgi:hypothetical protein
MKKPRAPSQARRKFTAPRTADRCTANVVLRDGSGAGLERNNLVISGGSSSENRANDQVNKVQPLTLDESLNDC